MNEQAHVAAVLGALNTQLATLGTGHPSAYDTDELGRMDSVPSEYVEVRVHPRYGGEHRVSTHTGVRAWRIVTTYKSTNLAENARALRRETQAALEYRVLTIDGQDTTPVAFETAVPIGTDEEHWVTGTDSWTYGI